MGIETLPIETTRYTYQVNNEARESFSYRPIIWVTIRPLKGGLPVNGPALIYTGATMTAIDLRVAQRFGFAASGTASILTADGEQSSNPMYEVQLSGIADYVQEFVITSCNVLEQGIMILLGTDVLANGKLIYDGITEEFTMDFPSTSQPGPST